MLSAPFAGASTVFSRSVHENVLGEGCVVCWGCRQCCGDYEKSLIIRGRQGELGGLESGKRNDSGRIGFAEGHSVARIFKGHSRLRRSNH